MEEQIRQLKEQGKSYGQIAELLGITNWRVRVTLNPHMLKGTESIDNARIERNNKIVELFEQGYSSSEIGKKFNLSRASIDLIVKGARQKKREADMAEYERLRKTIEYKKIKTITIFRNGEIYNNGERLSQVKHVDGNCIRYFVQMPNGKGGYRRNFVHSLVALAFVPNETGYKYVIHLDGNPKNCNAENLKWDFPRTRERRLENVHKIAPALDEFDYEGSEYMGRAIYDFLKTGNEWHFRELFKKEEKYFIAVILNEFTEKRANSIFTAKDIYEFFIERIISKVSRGFFLPKKENWRFVVYCRQTLKKDILTYYKSKHQTISIDYYG